MNSLDPRSLIAMGGFMALVMGLVLGFMRRYYPPSILGLGYWALAPAAWLIATVFFAAPGPWLQEVGRWLGNGLILLGFILFHVGCRRFFERPVQWRRIVIPFALVMLSLAWFAGPEPSYRMRVAIVTAAIAVTHTSTLVFLWQSGNRNFPVRMVQATLALHLCVLLVRLQTVLSVPEVGDLMEASTVQTYYLGAYVLAVLLLSIGAVLMATDRVRTELEHMATHDALTGTLNRRAILECCADEHERSLRYKQPFALMMIDLDHFKTINDTHGHQHGDRVLVHFADSTRSALRRADRFGRYGGEEFLILLPNTAADVALPVAERIRAALSAGHALDCQASIGLTHWRGPEDTLDAMLGRADAALYQAKAQGRNQTCST
ncbi:MAG: GGDEF domain-containing protein [Burkholderiaceae bacterium]|nr:GGDEF domain-containing protein [Burkholderiaceae bacterium]MCO5111424.1 GGDEF domain-containing protein [Burkholderiaceae bacterium]